jgi:hypothetical protein
MRKIAGIKWVTAKEFRDMLEARCQRTLGISLREFRKRMKAGKYRKTTDTRVEALMMLVRI